MAIKWLLADALAPALGIAATHFFSLSDVNLGLLLALFAGFFFYIGASDLLPESHHRHSSVATILMTVLGAAAIYVVIQLAHI